MKRITYWGTPYSYRMFKSWGACMHRGTRNSYRILVGKSHGTRPFWRPRCRWDNRF